MQRRVMDEIIALSEPRGRDERARRELLREVHGVPD